MSRDSLIEAVVQRDLNEDACKMLQAEISRLQASEQHWRLWGQACEKKLNAQLDETCRLQAENERQSARIAELEEALRPFAMIGDPSDYPRRPAYPQRLDVPFEWCERARAALKGDGEKGLHPDSLCERCGLKPVAVHPKTGKPGKLCSTCGIAALEAFCDDAAMEEQGQ